MRVDEALLARLRVHLSEMADVQEKAMFGGIGFMLRGNLLCGVMGDELLVRIAKQDQDRAIGDGGAHPMVMGGRSSKGWILVPSSGVATKRDLKRWVDRAVGFVGAMPAK